MSKSSIYERFKFLLGRLCSRYDPETLEYLRATTKLEPTFDIDEGREARYRSTSAIRHLTQSWRNADKMLHKPMSEKELSALQNQCDKALVKLKPKEAEVHATSVESHPLQSDQQQSRSSNRDFWKDNGNLINFKPGLIQLPQATALVINPKDGTRVVHNFLIDSGASISILPKSSLQQLNISVSQLDTSVNFKISTALSSTSALGFVRLPVFLCDVQGRINKHILHLVVIDSPNLKRGIWGCDSLCFLSYRLEYKHPKHLLTLWSISQSNSVVRRTYNLSDPLNPVVFNNKTEVKQGREMSVFHSTEVPAFEEGKALNFTCSVNSVKIGEVKAADLKLISKSEVDEDGYPIKFYSELELPVFAMEAHEAQSVRVTAAASEETKAEALMEVFTEKGLEELEAELNSISHQEDEEEDLNLQDRMDKVDEEIHRFEHDIDTDPEMMDGVEQRAMDEALDALNPAPPEVPGEGGSEPIIPDVSHLQEPWRSRYRELFTEFQDCFSQRATDLGLVSKLPPAEVRLRPNAPAPVAEGSRRYSPLELDIIAEHISNMEAAGVIEQVDISNFDPRMLHYLHLVPKHSKSEKLDRSGGSTSRKSQLTDAASCRITHDLRKVNGLLEPSPPLVLPTVYELLPLCQTTKMSGVDLKSGFWQCAISEKSRNFFDKTDTTDSAGSQWVGRERALISHSSSVESTMKRTSSSSSKTTKTQSGAKNLPN